MPFVNVTATWNKTNFVPGEQMILTVAGTFTTTTPPTTVDEVFPGGVLALESESGAKGSVNVSSVVVQRTIPGTTVNEQVLVDAPAGATLVLGGRSFTVSADRKSLSSIA